MNESQRALGKLSAEALLRSVRAEIANSENFEIAREHLKTGSILVYFNHFAKLDVILYGKVLHDNLAPFDQLTAIAARKHFDPKRGRLSQAQKYLIDGWQEAYGVGLIQVVQPKDKDSYEDSDEFNRKSVLRARELLKTPGKAVGIAPEGTRSKSNELLQAENGLELFLRVGNNVLALPLATEHSSIVPLATKSRVIVGKPFTYDEIKKEHEENPKVSITDLMMKRIATLLPEKNRGYYK